MIYLGVAGSFLFAVLILGLPFSQTAQSTAQATAGATALAGLEQSALPLSHEAHTRTIKLINFLIKKSHYRGVTLDDEFSELVYHRFIETLDPAKSFFLRDDIERFDALKYDFDEYIQDGNLQPAYAIFKLYRSRVEAQIEFALNRLHQPFDFTVDEFYTLDLEYSRWMEGADALNHLWRKRIKNDIITLRLADKDEAEIINILEKRYTHIARRVRQFKSEDVFQSFINAYVSTIEPHTSYYSPRGAENFKINMRLSLEGIGAVLQSENEYTLIRRIIPGGPADLAGELQPDDRIIGVGQAGEEIVDVIGWRLDDVVELIRGAKQTVVNLEILPGAIGVDGESRIITIVRDKIKLEEQAASSDVLEIESDRVGFDRVGFDHVGSDRVGSDRVGSDHAELKSVKAKIGVITLPSFYSDFDGQNVNDPNYRSTTRDVKKLLLELKKQAIDGLIIDLRGNGGGALSEAIGLTGLFIRQGPVVQVQNSSGSTQVDRDTDPDIFYAGPLVVLVDRYSASASEIFAAAMQDYHRGLIIGEPTFGKGTVQNLLSLNRFVNTDADLGQLKVTIAQFFRINGGSTQHRGVIPDITWHTSEIDNDSGERAFKNALPWRTINEVAFSLFDFADDAAALSQANNQYLARAMNNPEFNYRLAINEINRATRETKAISLREDERRKIRQKRDKQRLNAENIRRQTQGKPTVNSIKTIEKRVENAIENEYVEENYIDPFLLETGRILVDYSSFKNLSANSKQLNTQNQNIRVGEKINDKTDAS